MMDQKSQRLPLDVFDRFRDELDSMVERRCAEALKDIKRAAHKARRKVGCSAGQASRRMRERIERG